jgi:hypothetical protein
MKTIFHLLLAIALLSLQVRCDCATLKCEKCCDDASGECIDDILRCPLTANDDFSILVTILIILASFGAGKNLKETTKPIII